MKCLNPKVPCFIHASFFVHHIQQERCACGKQGSNIDFDQNLFAETINMIQMLKSLDNTLMDATEKHKMSSRSLQTTSQVYVLRSIRE